MYRQKLLRVLLFFCTVLMLLPSFAQNKSISGVVMDAKGDPLSDATVSVKGTQAMTRTNAAGTFTLTVPAGGTTLVVSYVGMQNTEVSINGKTEFSIVLQSSDTKLEEVVVVGYGTTKKSDLTGSVATLKGGDLAKTPSVSVDQLLQGKIPGVQVIAPSGEPGAGTTIRIRGLSSINGSNSPLYVVDGFPWGDAGDLKQINPEDIESIEVLKDASAAAIYGSRGANGVIMITTRKGRNGQARITLSTLNTISTPANKMDLWRDPVELAVVSNEARINAGLVPLYTGQVYLGTYFPSVAELRGIDPDKPKWPYQTDWADVVYRNPFSQSYTLSADGGNDRTKYSVSGNYYKQEGMAIQNYYDKYTGRLNLDQKVHDKVNLGTNIIITHTNRNRGGLSADRNPIFPVYNEDGTYFKEGPLDFGNPIAYLNGTLNKSKTIDVLGTLYANWEITKWLQFRSQISNKYGNSINDWYETRWATFWGNANNGVGNINNWSGNELLNENYFTINKSFSKAHALNFVAGYTTQLSTSRGSRLEGLGFVNDNLKNENLNAADEFILSNWLSRSVLNSYIGRASYSLMDRYLFTFTARADGSSKFGKNNKWGFFPSGAFAWKIHEERFMENLPDISEAKLRVSYGFTGNQGISPGQTLDRLGSGRYYSGGDFQLGYGPGVYGWDGYNKIWNGLANQDLKWETTSQFNVGLDVSLFNKRINLTGDYYFKHTKDLLRLSRLAPSSGYDQLWVNDGEIENKGVELGVNALVLNQRRVTVNVGGSFTLNRNELVSLGENKFVWNGSNIEMLRSPANAFIVGEPINVFYGYRTDGILQSEEEGYKAGLTGNMAKAGEIKYVDLDENGVVDDNDRVVIGNPNPDFLYSFNTSVKYSGFDLSAQLYGVSGNDVFDFRKFSPSRQLQRWTVDNPNNEYPRVHATRAYLGSDWFITDGSFLRVQNMTLGYTFNRGAIKGINSLRVYLSGNNLYTFTQFNPGFDPEVPENGQHWGSYPRSRAYSLGINLGL